MKRAFVGFGLVVGLFACSEIAMPGSTSASPPTAGGGFSVIPRPWVNNVL
jgi:hypothetical protein